jgi:predicted negative regulator of RcsB-dependent stress response
LAGFHRARRVFWRCFVPQVIVLALLGAGAYMGYRWVVRTSREIAAEMQRAQDELRRGAPSHVERDLGRLEYDPQSGVYRPVKRG